MNVVIHFSSQPSAQGGGHTFEATVIDGLKACLDETEHRFVVSSPMQNDRRLSSQSLGVRFAPLNSGFFVQWADRLNTVAKLAQDHLWGARQLRGRSQFQRTIDRLGADFVWFASPCHLHCDTPYIFTVWDLQHTIQPWFPEVSQNGQWERRSKSFHRSIGRAVRVIVPNQTGKRELLEAFPIGEERIAALPHPVPALETAPDPVRVERTLSKYGLQRGFIFYPAQFWPHKNHIVLLHALRKLRASSFPDLCLVMVGSDKGNLEHVMQTAANMALSNAVHHLGFIPMSDLIDLYACAGVLAYPTLFGPENLPPLEAFSLGCPVVASRVPGSDEQLGDAAILVDPTDPEAYAQAIAKVLNDPEFRQTLTNRGRERATRWTGRDYVRAVFDMLDEFALVRRCWPMHQPWDG